MKKEEIKSLQFITYKDGDVMMVKPNYDHRIECGQMYDYDDVKVAQIIESLTFPIIGITELKEITGEELDGPVWQSRNSVGGRQVLIYRGTAKGERKTDMSDVPTTPMKEWYQELGNRMKGDNHIADLHEAKTFEAVDVRQSVDEAAEKTVEDVMEIPPSEFVELMKRRFKDDDYDLTDVILRTYNLGISFQASQSTLTEQQNHLLDELDEKDKCLTIAKTSRSYNRQELLKYKALYEEQENIIETLRDRIILLEAELASKNLTEQQLQVVLEYVANNATTVSVPFIRGLKTNIVDRDGILAMLPAIMDKIKNK